MQAYAYSHRGVNTTLKISTIVDISRVVIFILCQYDFKNFYYCRLGAGTLLRALVNTTLKISTIVDVRKLMPYLSVNTTLKISTIVDY